MAHSAIWESLQQHVLPPRTQTKVEREKYSWQGDFCLMVPLLILPNKASTEHSGCIWRYSLVTSISSAKVQCYFPEKWTDPTMQNNTTPVVTGSSGKLCTLQSPETERRSKIQQQPHPVHCWDVHSGKTLQCLYQLEQPRAIEARPSVPSLLSHWWRGG